MFASASPSFSEAKLQIDVALVCVFLVCAHTRSSRGPVVPRDVSPRLDAYDDCVRSGDDAGDEVRRGGLRAQLCRSVRRAAGAWYGSSSRWASGHGRRLLPRAALVNPATSMSSALV